MGSKCKTKQRLDCQHRTLNLCQATLTFLQVPRIQVKHNNKNRSIKSLKNKTEPGNVFKKSKYTLSDFKGAAATLTYICYT